MKLTITIQERQGGLKSLQAVLKTVLLWIEHGQATGNVNADWFSVQWKMQADV